MLFNCHCQQYTWLLTSFVKKFELWLKDNRKDKPRVFYLSEWVRPNKQSKMTEDLTKHFPDANEMSNGWLVIDITKTKIVVQLLNRRFVITGTMVMLPDNILRLKATTIWEVVTFVKVSSYLHIFSSWMKRSQFLPHNTTAVSLVRNWTQLNVREWPRPSPDLACSCTKWQVYDLKEAPHLALIVSVCTA